MSIVIVTKGEAIMKKYLIKQLRDHFTVWKLTNYGNGYSYDDVKRTFSSEEEAQKFIEEDRQKEGDKS